jgi:predicted PurR-regulated permease PerM
VIGQDRDPSSSTAPLGGRVPPSLPPSNRMVVEIQARTVAKVLAMVLALAFVVGALEAVRTVLVWFFIALFIAFALNPAVTVVERRMSRTAAVVVVFGVFVISLLLVLTLLVAPFVSQIDNIVADAPHAAERVAQNPVVHRLDQRYDIIDRAKEHASQLPGVVFGAAGSIISGVTATVTVLFLAAFMLFEFPRMGEIVLAQLRPEGAARAREIAGHLDRTIGGYVIGNLLISVIAGTVATLAMWALGTPYALTLGVVVAIGDLIPLVGATLASIIVVVTTYFTCGTTAALILFAVIMIYQQIENHVLQPVVYRRTLQVPSLVVLLAVLVGASVLGLVGALVAIPIAGTLHVVVSDLLDERARRIAAENREAFGGAEPG